MSNPIMAGVRPATCKPWCVQHNAAEGVCVGPVETTPGSEYSEPTTIGLSFTPGDGTVIEVAGLYLPLHEAKRFALSLMRQIERARADESLLTVVGR
ncbi:hypothetical protein ACFYOK_10895 [Microbispora bryophytorum]|uniref:hypothetical protein n=1 Tax=Microbispora bryophytorum TaxID=1460882 RepID=UPI0033EC3E4D